MLLSSAPIQDFRTKAANRLLAVLLICGLLLAQWAGLEHAIAHADRYQVQASAAVTASGPHNDGAGEALSHSCLIFDSTLLGAALYTAVFAGFLLPDDGMPRLDAAILSWNAPFSRHFSSRAPPLA